MRRPIQDIRAPKLTQCCKICFLFLSRNSVLLIAENKRTDKYTHVRHLLIFIEVYERCVEMIMKCRMNAVSVCAVVVVAFVCAHSYLQFKTLECEQ